jgi:maleylacetate reductase
MAEEGTRAPAAALPAVVADGRNLDVRAEAQYGAWLCGAVLAATTMSLHHMLCHTLGGTLDLPHAQTHTLVLPHALAYNQPAAPAAVAALSWALRRCSRPRTRALGARRPPVAARAGHGRGDIPRITEQAVADPYANPRPVTPDGVTALLHDAWSG